MALYHFCNGHMKDAILREGLTLGGYPLIQEGRMIPNIQWLTSERDPRKQSWATRTLLPYSRTEYRLTVEIPSSYRKRLFRAKEYIKVLPEKDRGIVTDWAGSNAWYVYLGKIPAKWIIGCKKMREGKQDERYQQIKQEVPKVLSCQRV